MESLELQDIHLPPTADIWPLAIGWWILLVLIIAIASWLIIKTLQRIKRKKHQAKILAKFTALEEKLKAEPSNTVIAEINTLLRQLAITYYPRAEIASLTGADWLQFLDESGDTQDFSRGAGRILIEAPYRQERRKESGKERRNESGKENPKEPQIENLNINELLPLLRSWTIKIVRGNA